MTMVNRAIYRVDRKYKPLNISGMSWRFIIYVDEANAVTMFKIVACTKLILSTWLLRKTTTKR